MSTPTIGSVYETLIKKTSVKIVAIALAISIFIISPVLLYAEYRVDEIKSAIKLVNDLKSASTDIKQLQDEQQILKNNLQDIREGQNSLRQQMETQIQAINMLINMMRARH